MFCVDPNDFNPGLDIKEFQSPHFQRVYQYLKLSQQGVNLDNFTFVPGKIDEDQETCLSLLLRSVKYGCVHAEILQICSRLESSGNCKKHETRSSKLIYLQELVQTITGLI